MAAFRSKPRKASDSSAGSVSRGVQNPSISTRTIAIKTGSPAIRTPERMMSPNQKRRKAITQAQKQALMDNLQLEISERARKLRAQYSLQAQGLRTRIEIRVNRIPMALRKANIGELLAKYSEEQEPSNAAKSQMATAATAEALPTLKDVTKNAEPGSNSSPSRGTKRLSDEISCNADKENDSHADLQIPKKRTKVAAAPAASTRTASRSKPAASQVLSPKSYNANSKSLLRSPIRPMRLKGKASAQTQKAEAESKAKSTVGRVGGLTMAAKKAAAASMAAAAAVEVPAAGKRILRKRK